MLCNPAGGGDAAIDGRCHLGLVLQEVVGMVGGRSLVPHQGTSRKTWWEAQSLLGHCVVPWKMLSEMLWKCQW